MTKVFNRPVEINGGIAVVPLKVNGVDIKAQAALVAAIPTTDQEDSETIWNDGGVLKVSSAGS